VYCRNCITQHIESVPPPAACPLCRGAIKISLLLEAARDEENEEASKEFEDIIVEASSTKVMAVMKELVAKLHPFLNPIQWSTGPFFIIQELCRRKNGDEKIIICSQFTSLLSIFQPLLSDVSRKTRVFNVKMLVLNIWGPEVHNKKYLKKVVNIPI